MKIKTGVAVVGRGRHVEDGPVGVAELDRTDPGRPGLSFAVLGNTGITYTSSLADVTGGDGPSRAPWMVITDR